MASDKQDNIKKVARKIRNAWKNGKTIKPVRDSLPKGDVDAAYQVQEINTEYWIDQGRRVVGRKIGLTAKAVQIQLGVDQPDYGMLYADMCVVDGDEIPAGAVTQPKVEAEIALVLDYDLFHDQLTLIDLIDDSYVSASGAPVNFIYSNGNDSFKTTMFQAIFHNRFDGNEDTIPTHSESISSFFPT